MQGYARLLVYPSCSKRLLVSIYGIGSLEHSLNQLSEIGSGSRSQTLNKLQDTFVCVHFRLRSVDIVSLAFAAFNSSRSIPMLGFRSLVG